MTKNLPEHIAIILDGNGRWAKKHVLPRALGHNAGAKALRKLAETMNENGFKILTVYAFSTENWKRDNEEVEAIMALLKDYVQNFIDDTEQNNMRVNFFGDFAPINEELRTKILFLNDLTKSKPGMVLNIALNYGGRDEILRAFKKMKKVSAKNADEKTLSSYMDLAEFPDPELLIRTSGEQRLSGFLLWAAAYAELYFTEKLWPDFTYTDLLEAVDWFNERERRFGGR